MQKNESKNQNFAQNFAKEKPKNSRILRQNSHKTPSSEKTAFRQRLMLKMLFGALILLLLLVYFFHLIKDDYAVIMLIIVALVLIFVFINSPKFKAKRNKKFDDFLSENEPKNSPKNDMDFKDKGENSLNKFA